MRTRLYSFTVLFLYCLACLAIPRQNIAKTEGLRIFKTMLCNPSNFPVSFTYNGVAHKGLGGLKVISREVVDTDDGHRATMLFALDDVVQVTTVARYNDDFGEVEYTVWFSNISKTDTSAILEKFVSADINFKGLIPRLRGNLGDHENQYAAYDRDIIQPITFRSDGGRATHIVFPYFDLVHGNGGTLLAIGWAGTWNASFTAKGNTTRWQASNCNDFCSVLLPGESVRTALIVMLPYKGRNADDATNLWRDWFINCNMPRANAAGDHINPFSTACFASDTGLHNSDGSISERFYTWRRTLDRLVYENVIPDFRWFDAGWYFDTRGNTVPENWWGTVGSWELDTIKWPGKTFRESNEACHKAGMKVLMWFEPERVTGVDGLVENYGYKPEWAISNGHDVITNDLGNPECLEWTLKRITKVMDENAVDMYREDNNSDPGTTWPMMDNLQTSFFGKPRKGITENKAVVGHYALWDGIIRFCADNGKCTFIDNCASGGGRNDIESMRRSLPLLRSDADRTTSALRLSMSSTFNKWIPFCGSSTKESVGQLDNGMAGGSTGYFSRASWLPVYNISECYTHDVLLDYNRMRKNVGEWRKYNHLLLKDFYVLTPWHSPTDTSGWTVFAYSDPATGEAVITAFRQETSAESTFIAKLPFVEQKASYTLTNEDTHEQLHMSGTQLRADGITIVLGEPKSSAVWHIEKR